jgi:SWI/SNF-related matrix-associated actin-dependent regulator 1 of chromatin subfamily A
MVRVSRSAEAIPLLVPNDALRRDEARAGAGPARGRRGAGEHSGSRSVLVATLLLSVSGAVMYAASSSLAAEERADMRARINDARAVSRASFLPETLLPSTSASVNAELRRMTAQAGDLGAFADATEGTRADATSEPAGAFRAAGASCSCACCVGSACELEALTAALGARSAVGGDEAGETGHPEAAKSDETRSRAVVRSFDAGSPAACDAEACRARFADACPKHASAGIVSARFHAESAPGASARTAFESFETSMVGAVFDEAAATQTPFEDVYAPPSADDVRRAEEWVRDATMKAHAAEAAITDTVGAVAEASGLTPEQIEESAARAEAEQAAEDAAEAAATEQNPAQAPEEAAEAPEEAAQEAAQAPEEAAQEAARLPRKPRRKPRRLRGSRAGSRGIGAGSRAGSRGSRGGSRGIGAGSCAGS